MKMTHHDSLMKAELVTARFSDLVKIRFPWLIVGFVGAFVASFIVSRFELSLQENVALAFFIPVIAYMSDAVGSQTETILIRALTDLKFNIFNYVLREFILGGIIGILLGIIAGLFAYLISGSGGIGFVVAISLFFSMTLATTLACITPIMLKRLGKDPAVASGPFTTAIQDSASLLIYFSVAILML